MRLELLTADPELAADERPILGNGEVRYTPLDQPLKWLLSGYTQRLLLTQSGRSGERADMLDVILKRFENPDETSVFEKGKFETVTLGGMTIGRATYEPGWKWSEDVGSEIGESFCRVEHVGMVISGCATAAFADGRVTEMNAGDIFYVPSEPHDSWVVGDEPYVSLHFAGAGKYAKEVT